jgi:hypothetical protein
MSTTLLSIVGVIYIGVTFSFLRDGNPGMALTFLGYTIAQVGLILATR